MEHLTCYQFMYQLLVSCDPSARIPDVHITAKTGNNCATTVHSFPVLMYNSHTLHDITYPLVGEVAQLIQRPTEYEVLL